MDAPEFLAIGNKELVRETVADFLADPILVIARLGILLPLQVILHALDALENRQVRRIDLKRIGGVFAGGINMGAAFADGEFDADLLEQVQDFLGSSSEERECRGRR